MRKFVIERDIPGASKLSEAELKAITEKSCAVATQMGHPYHWVQSFVAGDKFYCIHIAPNEEKIREHAELGGFPVTSISEVHAIIDPSTQ